MLFSAALLVFHLSIILPTQSNPDSDSNRLSQLQTTESHLMAKATTVLERFTNNPFSIDLSVELDHTKTHTKRYQPGPQTSGTWYESRDDQPRVRLIKCCVTIQGERDIDTDHLFRCLSYSIGLDLSRGDLLKIVTL